MHKKEKKSNIHIKLFAMYILYSCFTKCKKKYK